MLLLLLRIPGLLPCSVVDCECNGNTHVYALARAFYGLERITTYLQQRTGTTCRRRICYAPCSGAPCCCCNWLISHSPSRSKPNTSGVKPKLPCSSHLYTSAVEALQTSDAPPQSRSRHLSERAGLRHRAVGRTAVQQCRFKTKQWCFGGPADTILGYGKYFHDLISAKTLLYPLALFPCCTAGKHQATYSHRTTRDLTGRSSARQSTDAVRQAKSASQGRCRRYPPEREQAELQPPAHHRPFVYAQQHPWENHCRQATSE